MIYLHYSKEKGLFKSNSDGDTTILESHSDNGWKTIKKEIPEINVKLEVHTNFGYGKSVAYFNGYIYINGMLLPNFIDTDGNGNINYVSADPVEMDWEGLFDKMIALYDSRFNSDAIIRDYFENMVNDFDRRISKIDNSTSKLLAEANKTSKKLVRIIQICERSIFSDNKCIANGMIPITSKLVGLYLSSYDEVKMDNFSGFEEDMNEILQYVSTKGLVLNLLRKYNDCTKI